MMHPADLKAAQALAEEIAALLRGLPTATTRVEVLYSRPGKTYGVRLRINGHRYDMLMPAPGAMFPLWRDGAFLGASPNQPPYDVVLWFLDQVAATV